MRRDKFEKWEALGWLLALLMLPALGGLVYGIEVVRARIWAEALQKAGCPR